jgi:hypothetical protein
MKGQQKSKYTGDRGKGGANGENALKVWAKPLECLHEEDGEKENEKTVEGKNHELKERRLGE